MKVENRYTYRTEWCPEDNCYISRVLEFPSLSAFGVTRAEAEAELDLVLEDVLKWMAEEKEVIPVPLTEKEYKGNISLRIPSITHRNVVLMASNEGLSVNQYITSLIERNLYCDSISTVLNTFENKIQMQYETIQKMTLINAEILKKIYSLTNTSFYGQDEQIQNVSETFFSAKKPEQQLII